MTQDKNGTGTGTGCDSLLGQEYQADPVQAEYNADNQARRLQDDVRRICDRPETEREQERMDFFYGQKKTEPETTTPRELARAVEQAESLSELRDCLAALDAQIRSLIDAGTLPPDAITDDYTDTSSLPVFGGTEPANTMGLYSWDKDSVLYIGDSEDGTGWIIEARGKYWA